MERFVRLIVAGGVALVAGLRLVSLFERVTTPSLAGAALALLGAGALGVGVASEIEY
jgi:hypothetical protein